MLVTCSPEKKDALVFTILIQRLRNKAGDAGTKNLIKTHGLQGSGWGLSAEGVLAKDVPGGLDILTLAKRALKGNEKLPDSGLIPVMKRTNEKALNAMVKNAEGSFVTVGGFRFYKPNKALAHEFTKGNQTWDIPAGGISPRVIQVRVNGWKITKQGLVENREADGSSRRTGSAILHVDADKWEEFGLANALQDLIDNPKSGTTGLSKSAVADLARKVQREALSYRESDGARTSKKVLFRDKGKTEEPIQQEILSESPNDATEPEYSSAPNWEDESLFDTRTDDFFEDYYEEYPYAEEPPVKSREPGEDDDLVPSTAEPQKESLLSQAMVLAEKEPMSQSILTWLDTIDRPVEEKRLLYRIWKTMEDHPSQDVPSLSKVLSEDMYFQEHFHAVQKALDEGASRGWKKPTELEHIENLLKKFSTSNEYSSGFSHTKAVDLNTINFDQVGMLEATLKKETKPPEEPVAPSETDRLTEIETRLTSLEQKAATQVETDLGNAGWETKPEIIHDSPEEILNANKVILPPERLKTQIATIVPSMPRLTGYKPYMDALKDPAQAEQALQALISHNSELASAYAKAVTELHKEGGVSQATLDTLFKRPCS